MDSVFIMWAFVLVLPIIITTALCIHCREGAPTRIPQSVDDYEYKPPGEMSHSSFTVLRSSNYAQQRGPLDPPTDRMDHFLSISSLQHPESRRSSFAKLEVDKDSIPSYENEEPVQPDIDYSNEDYICGYIEVIPDNPDTSVSQSTPMESGKSASLSSAFTDDYQNVPEQQRDSVGDSLEYVNVPEKKESADISDNNYDDTNDQETDDDDDTPDYENIEKQKRG
ncbi:linker for activation of T-cells family member 1 [Lissotriton helveticus]